MMTIQQEAARQSGIPFPPSPPGLGDPAPVP
jgi:hypothetical protein